jgi:DNA-binding CsgD family transcriptional regulator
MLGDRQDLHFKEEIAWVVTFLEVSLGHYEAAVRCAGEFAIPMVESDVVEPLLVFDFFPDLIEALVSIGDLDRAALLTDALEERGRATSRPWALATGGRCRGLVEGAAGHLDEAVAALEQALREHERVPMPLERARTLLVYGVVLRRSRRRRAARNSMDAALRIFEHLGARLWVQRTHAELARIGGRASRDELTPTEAQVAALAAAGETNREIAQVLFMSVKTVEANLSRVYRKLDISSRRQLGARLNEPERQT